MLIKKQSTVSDKHDYKNNFVILVNTYNPQVTKFLLKS